jgi:hypothetical protein
MTNGHPMFLRSGMSECNRYDDQRRPAIWEMKEIAWQLMTDKGGKSIGFISAEDLKKRNMPPPNIPGFG